MRRPIAPRLPERQPHLAVGRHGEPRGREGPLRRSGLTSLGMFALMAVTGYLLPVLVSDSLRVVTLWLHVGSGIAFAVSYLVHVVGGLLLWRSVPAVQRSPSA